jgi:hypothetical protein
MAHIPANCRDTFCDAHKNRETIMLLDDLLTRPEVERIYQHVLKLEGIKHPIDAPEKLRQAGDYILNELASYGVATRTQEFRFDGWDDTFRNIEGWIGNPDEPAAVLINHHDTVSSTFGANDNAAGVAVMLEIARVLANEKDIPCIRFVSATLEEGLPPTAKAAIRASALKNGITDSRGRYTTHRIAQTLQTHNQLTRNAMQTGKSHYDALIAAREKLRDEITPALANHLEVIERAYVGLTTATAIGKVGKIGSSRWVDESVAIGKEIQFAICLDEIGITSKRAHSQTLPEGVTYSMMQTYKVDTAREIGDWAFVIADPAAAQIAQTFLHYCQHSAIDLPHAFFQMPDFQTIAARFPQAFGSDHAPFWRAGIPALFAFDTSTWRSPFCHSLADTIDRLDFVHITKIAKATMATLIDSMRRS